MASSLVLTLSMEDSQAVLQQRLQPGTNNAREVATQLEVLMKKLKGGQLRSSLSVQTAAAAPVAASGTWTLVSVVATDEADLGGVAFTFTATPTLETDVMVTVPSAKAFASSTDLTLATGSIAETAHGYVTGDACTLTTSGTLPTGLATSTTYYVIKVTADIYRLATTLARAQAGIQIIPTGLGSGNQTVTITPNTYKAAKLAAAVNAHSTLASLVVASYASNVVTITAKQKGIVGNFIQFTDQDSTITSTGSGYLAGGTGGATDTAVVYSLGL